MNKRELVDAVAAKVGRPRAEVASTVDAVFELISTVLARGEKVAISGFGNFDARQVAERVARNPRTGESVAVPARTAARFKASRNLKTALGG
ncbi:MAG: HU family DNA-binding protein [Actinomycetota bacterium]